MARICILTDGSAQFPQLAFPGRGDMRILPFSVEVNGQRYEDGPSFRSADLPPAADDDLRPRVISPSVEAFHEMFVHLSTQYSDVLAILSSSQLTQACANATEAAMFVRGRLRVSVLDSQSISIGLGLLVQTAAEAVSSGKSVVDVEALVRSMVPHVYMMFCTPGLSYMHQAGFLDAGQAFIGDMLGLMPIFTLEEGKITAVEKVRNARGLIDFMQEFLCEFEDLAHIAFLQSTTPMAHEVRAMREHAQTCFPQVPFSEHGLNLPLATLIGPRSVGMVAFEKVE